MSPSHQRIKKPWAVATQQPLGSPESATETPPLQIFFYSTEQKEFLLTATPVKEEIERERGRGGNTESSVAWVDSVRAATTATAGPHPGKSPQLSWPSTLLPSLLCLLSLSSPTAAAVAASTLRFLPLPLPHSLTHPSSISPSPCARGLEISRFAPEIRGVDPPAASSSSGGWARRRRPIRFLPRRIGGRCQRAGLSGSVVASMIHSDRRRRRRRRR